MSLQPTPAAAAVVEALRHLSVGAHADGSQIHISAGGDPIAVHLDEPGPEATQIVVRDQVTPSIRRKLSESGIGWLDLRGRLSVRTPTLVVEADVPGDPELASQRRTQPLAGSVVSGVTIAALATWPKPLPGIRGTARMIDATPGGVSLALKRLTAAGYVTSDHRATADLFWAAADEWRPKWVELPVTAVPPGSEAAAVGALAAAQLGAPIAVTADTAIEILLPSAASLKYASLAAKTNPAGAPTARIAVAPSPIANVLLHPRRLAVHMIPVAAEAIVALSLAIDPARGAETVRAWEGGPHVWN
jgi:hypothetical protein